MASGLFPMTGLDDFEEASQRQMSSCRWIPMPHAGNLEPEQRILSAKRQSTLVSDNSGSCTVSNELQQFVERVETFPIDSDNKSLRFVDRLARENNWSVQFAERVVLEYKRFCILAMKSGHPVTPSEQVDQAWHLHLTYTRSYWDRFCKEALGRPLHHEPTEGGVSENDKFHDWYAKTLSSYCRVFDAQPPADIWPSPAKRFAHAGAWKWVNAGRYWVIPKRVVWALAATFFVILTIAALPGCRLAIASGVSDQFLFMQEGSMVGSLPNGIAEFILGLGEFSASIFPFNLGAIQFLLVYGFLCLVVLLVLLVMKIISSVSETQASSMANAPKLGIDELAVLSGGGKRLAQVSLTRLYADDRIGGVEQAGVGCPFCVKDDSSRPENSAVDRDLYDAIQAEKPRGELIRQVKPHFDRIECSLIERGLRYKSSFSPLWLLSIGFVIGIGAIRCLQAYLADEESGFLIMMMIAFTIISFLICNRPGRSTALGKAYLKNVKANAERNQVDLSDGNTEALALGVAVLGMSAIAGIDRLSPLNAPLHNIGTSSTGGGCGAGCGGGGGGCGGGGCGGCGG